LRAAQIRAFASRLTIYLLAAGKIGEIAKFASLIRAAKFKANAKAILRPTPFAYFRALSAILRLNFASLNLALADFKLWAKASKFNQSRAKVKFALRCDFSPEFTACLKAT